MIITNDLVNSTLDHEPTIRELNEMVNLPVGGTQDPLQRKHIKMIKQKFPQHFNLWHKITKAVRKGILPSEKALILYGQHAPSLGESSDECNLIG
jgi:hypothetical protein